LKHGCFGGEGTGLLLCVLIIHLGLWFLFMRNVELQTKFIFGLFGTKTRVFGVCGRRLWQILVNFVASSCGACKLFTSRFKGLMMISSRGLIASLLEGSSIFLLSLIIDSLRRGIIITIIVAHVISVLCLLIMINFEEVWIISI